MAKYRLPAALGGGEIEGTYSFADKAGLAVSARHQYEAFLDCGGVILRFNEPLQEIKPPSIDEPAKWPLTLNDSGGRWISLADMGGELTTIRVGYRDRDWGIDLSPSDLRWIARAAWQRAAAVDGA